MIFKYIIIFTVFKAFLLEANLILFILHQHKPRALACPGSVVYGIEIILHYHFYTNFGMFPFMSVNCVFLHS